LKNSLQPIPFLLLALGLWILACPAALAEDDDPKALNQQVTQLIEQGKYQEAIPIAEGALEVARRARVLENPETAIALDNLGFLFRKDAGLRQSRTAPSGSAQDLAEGPWP
jgi:hypothetical protein